jgi:DNA-binding transcriptional ArsR family regulator
VAKKRHTPAPVAAIAERLLDERGHFSAGEVAAAAKISRQAAHKRLRALVKAGMLVLEGAGRGARYRRTGHRPAVFSLSLRGLDEAEVWRKVAAIGTFAGLPKPAEDILYYALTEMVNNAIDHSAGKKVGVSAWRGARAGFEVSDDGVGVFRKVRLRLHLAREEEAIAELEKGKLTSAPRKHSGEGIFFTSRLADRFELESGRIRWVVDNAIDDTAIESVPPRTGTRVLFEIAGNTPRTLEGVFSRWTTELAFDKTSSRVRLYEISERFVSRSEAKRLVRGLEEFREVVLDFDRVRLVGQGFADEVFRVWGRAHPEVKLLPVNMTPAVEFMVRRALHAAAATP